MHEFGAGVPADLDLAKRNFDKARVVTPGADIPVQAALFSLGMHRRLGLLPPIPFICRRPVKLHALSR